MPSAATSPEAPLEGAKNPRPFFILANAVEMRGGRGRKGGRRDQGREHQGGRHCEMAGQEAFGKKVGRVEAG